MDAADGRLSYFESYLPIQRVPPGGPLIPEATARAIALQVYPSFISRPNPEVALAYNAPCYLAPCPPSRICSLAYLYELYERDEQGEVVGGIRVVVDAVTGEVWGAGPIFAGASEKSKRKPNPPTVPREARARLAGRLLSLPGLRRWALELALGEGQPSRPPDAKARRWRGSGEASNIELAREDRSRTLWVREGTDPWHVVKLTATQVANILAEAKPMKP